MEEIIIKPIKLLIGGSPCTFWSVAQHPDKRETTASGLGWELFENFLIAKDKFQPDFFLYENNKSMASAIKEQISYEFGVEPYLINSALVSAQNRQRYYWTNVRDVPIPEDRGIVLNDVLEEGDFKPYSGGELIRKKDDLTHKINKMHMIGATNKQCSIGCRVYDLLGKSKTICANGGAGGAKTGLYMTDNGIKSLSVSGCEKLQTMPKGYVKSIHPEKGITALGNGWTAEVIIHLLSHMLKDIPKDAPIEVLSMYDGIGTGRYCLEKMGYTNITYCAYEIDKYAIQVSMDNYPSIIQCGDAFQIRREEWAYNGNKCT